MKRVEVPIIAQRVRGGRGIKCPKCGLTRSCVTDSRKISGGNEVRRSNFCCACHHRFLTIERFEVDA